MSRLRKLLIALCCLTISSAFALELTENMDVIVTATGANTTIDIRSNNTSIATLYGDLTFNYSLYNSEHTLIRSFKEQTPFYDMLNTKISILDENNVLLNNLYRKNQFVIHSIYEIYSADNHKLATVTSNITRSKFIVFGDYGATLITLTRRSQPESKNPSYLIHIIDLNTVKNKHIDVATLLALIARENYL